MNCTYLFIYLFLNDFGPSPGYGLHYLFLYIYIYIYIYCLFNNTDGTSFYILSYSTMISVLVKLWNKSVHYPLDHFGNIKAASKTCVCSGKHYVVRLQ